MTTEEDDPLVQALPPATDYLTYLTLLEYQLTPARLPTLHRLLQDEVLTTNIGWDLVQLLLPMLPASAECLHDVARLGNPREVILRVADALMHLQPDGEEDDEGEENSERDAHEMLETTRNTSLKHIVKFNCLVTMLSVLHSRIQTKSPSRFIATSLQAVLEAYTLMPTSETTTAVLEFFRDVSPSVMRPALPPRGTSESSMRRFSEASAPDPEAEGHPSSSPPDDGDAEKSLITRLLQFGLVEVLKSYLLSFSSSPMDPGMAWAVRLQEKLYPETVLASSGSQTELYASREDLREKDMIVGRILALARDSGLTSEQLLEIVLESPDGQPSQLDFDELPTSPEGIVLERHGSLLLLAARNATSVIFSSGQEPYPVKVFPDLARIFANFIGEIKSSEEVALGQPQVLLDSLVALAVLSARQGITAPTNVTDYQNLVLQLTACASRQPYNNLRHRVPAAIFHSHPSPVERFRLLRRVLENEGLQSLRECAIGWLKDELLGAETVEQTPSSTSPPPNDTATIFLDPHYFSILLPSLFNSSDLHLLLNSDLVTSWIRFTQTPSLAPSIHAALSLYYILLSSPRLRARLQLEKTHPSFRAGYIEPLKSICHRFESDLTQNGGDGKIESVVGEETCHVGMARSVGVISLVLEQIEHVIGALDDDDGGDSQQEVNEDDVTLVEKIRAETAP